MAALFGATGETDAFIVAISVATLVTTVTGPVTVTFLPVYAAAAGKGDSRAAAKAASQVITLLGGFMMIAAMIMAAFAPQLTRLVAPGFGEDTYATAVSLTRIMLAAMALPLLASFAKSILNTKKDFVTPAFADIVENLVVVVMLVLLAPTLGVVSLGVASSVGFLVLFAIQYLSLRRSGLWPQMELGFGPDLRRMLVLALPLMGSSLFAGLHRFVDKALASRLAEGSLAVLEYAERIRGLPMGILVAAATTVMLPSLAGMWGRRDTQAFARTVEKNLRSIEFICIPVAAGLMVLAPPLVRLAFQRGAFTAEAARATAVALTAYAPGLAAMAAVRIIMTAFTSSQKMGLSVLVGICSALLNVGFDYAFISLGHVGLALASSVSGVLTFAVAALLLRREHGGHLNLHALSVSVGKMIVASTVMAAAAVRLSDATGLSSGTGSVARDIVSLTCISAVSIATYLVLARLLGCDEIKRIKEV
jgi:putative peptidoglycan lipid II flippase